jgi:hypothetical protein
VCVICPHNSAGMVSFMWSQHFKIFQPPMICSRRVSSNCPKLIVWRDCMAFKSRSFWSACRTWVTRVTRMAYSPRLWLVKQNQPMSISQILWSLNFCKCLQSFSLGILS